MWIDRNRQYHTQVYFGTGMVSAYLRIINLREMKEASEYW